MWYLQIQNENKGKTKSILYPYIQLLTILFSKWYFVITKSHYSNVFINIYLWGVSKASAVLLLRPCLWKIIPSNIWITMICWKQRWQWSLLGNSNPNHPIKAEFRKCMTGSTEWGTPVARTQDPSSVIYGFTHCVCGHLRIHYCAGGYTWFSSTSLQHHGVGSPACLGFQLDCGERNSVPVLWFF